MAFDNLIDWFKKKVDTSKKVYGPAQTIRLLEKCNTNVKINYRLILWKQRRKCMINEHVQLNTVSGG